jgi:hypothetical protein
MGRHCAQGDTHFSRLSVQAAEPLRFAEDEVMRDLPHRPTARLDEAGPKQLLGSAPKFHVARAEPPFGRAGLRCRSKIREDLLDAIVVKITQAQERITIRQVVVSDEVRNRSHVRIIPDPGSTRSCMTVKPERPCPARVVRHSGVSGSCGALEATRAVHSPCRGPSSRPTCITRAEVRQLGGGGGASRPPAPLETVRFSRLGKQLGHGLLVGHCAWATSRDRPTMLC